MRHVLPLLATAAFVLSPAAAQADLGDQLFKVLAADGAAIDNFGHSVAISGNIAVVGAIGDDDNGDGSGSAYLFDPSLGSQVAKLLPNDGAAWDRFGGGVAISGTTVIVGAAQDDNYSGSAYLFDISDPANWMQTFKLLSDDGAVHDMFGYSVAVSGSTAVVGAKWDDDNGSNSGSAYLFNTTTGQQIAKLLPDDGAAFDFFGRSVAISGPTAIVGAHRDDDNGNVSGSAYLFDTTTEAQIAKLLPDDGAADEWFGYSVAISGTTAIVGAHFDDDSGSAYLFDTTTGQQIVKLLPDDGAAQENVGYSVAISGTTAIVGAIGGGDNGAWSGSAYLFCAGDGATCPWDLDGDCAVGPFDLAFVLGHWGPNAGHPADFDGNGEVGPADLAILLDNWGLCP